MFNVARQRLINEAHLRHMTIAQAGMSLKAEADSLNVCNDLCRVCAFAISQRSDECQRIVVNDVRVRGGGRGMPQDDILISQTGCSEAAQRNPRTQSLLRLKKNTNGPQLMPV